jgi:hypothetical protein
VLNVEHISSAQSGATGVTRIMRAADEPTMLKEPLQRDRPAVNARLVAA